MPTWRTQSATDTENIHLKKLVETLDILDRRLPEDTVVLAKLHHLTAGSIPHVTGTFHGDVSIGNIHDAFIDDFRIVVENMKSVFSCNSSLIIDNTISIWTGNVVDNDLTTIVHHDVR